VSNDQEDIKMFLPKNEGGNFELVPAGTFIGRCYRFIDLGSHEQKFQGESKGLKRLVMIGFELPTETMEDGRPFSIHKRYTWSMHEKSAMRRDLESWRGQKFVDADFGPGGFDVRNLLGKTCTLSIVHSEGESTYANIASIGKAMKGIEVPAQINPSVYFSLEPQFFDPSVMDSLSDKLKETIRQTPEYVALQRRGTKSYAEQKQTHESDPARDPRYERQQYDDRNPPPPTDFSDLDDDFPGDRPSRREPHVLEAG
jgi:hypothetical protein